MKRYVLFLFVVFISVWAFSIALFSGSPSLLWLPDVFHKMTTASSYADLGNAMTALDGLFSSIAVILGLVAILFQGKELKASTDAQTLQAEALSKQIAQQNRIVWVLIQQGYSFYLLKLNIWKPEFPV